MPRHCCGELCATGPAQKPNNDGLTTEEAALRQVVLSDRPPLLLTRGRPGSISAAQFIHSCWPQHQPVVVATSLDRSQLTPVLDMLAERSLRVLEQRSEGRLVDETRRGYSAIVLGVNEPPANRC